MSKLFKTKSKGGDIYVESCGESGELFTPLNHPASWRSCQDAYLYTLSKDFQGYLRALSHRDSERLVKSHGFCPQNRCQLDYLLNSPENGSCPEGLCYSKIEVSLFIVCGYKIISYYHIFPILL
jgi:hypothetical protein